MQPQGNVKPTNFSIGSLVVDTRAMWELPMLTMDVCCLTKKSKHLTFVKQQVGRIVPILIQYNLFRSAFSELIVLIEIKEWPINLSQATHHQILLMTSIGNLLVIYTLGWQDVFSTHK